MQRLLASGELFNRRPLHNKTRRRVYANNPSCSCSQHAPAVVAITTTDIQHQAVVQGRYMRQQALPLPVRAPFGVEVKSVDFIRAFAPGNQLLQSLAQGLLSFTG